MKRYRNLSGNSGVIAYDDRPGVILVRFTGGDIYEYTDASAGAPVVAEMQRLARAGRGLSSYIARHRPRYESAP